VLGGLEGQRFVYFAAEDDQSAFSGMSEVMALFDTDAAPYASAQWDGNWSTDELSAAANELFSQGQDANFVSWASGTIDASSGGMMGGPNGGDGAAGGMNGGMMGGDGAEGGMGPGGAGGMNGGMMGGDNADGGDGAEGGMGPGGAGGMMGGASYHMASFDYAYRCIAAMEWLFQE
jgi:hypothetical protein